MQFLSIILLLVPISCVLASQNSNQESVPKYQNWCGTKSSSNSSNAPVEKTVIPKSEQETEVKIVKVVTTFNGVDTTGMRSTTKIIYYSDGMYTICFEGPKGIPQYLLGPFNDLVG